MKTTQGFSDAMKMTEPGSWNVAQVCCHRELSYHTCRKSSTYLENNHESSNNYPTDSKRQFHTEKEKSCLGDARREDSHDHRSLSGTQALIGLQLAMFPSVDPKFRLIRGPKEITKDMNEHAHKIQKMME